MKDPHAAEHTCFLFWMCQHFARATTSRLVSSPRATIAGGALWTEEHLERRRLHNTCPLCRARGCWNPVGFYFLRLFCLSNEILREIWHPAAPADLRVCELDRTEPNYTGRSLDIPLVDSSSSDTFLPPPAPTFTFFFILFLGCRELRDLERAAVLTHVHAFS